ncbi:hypothetical protein QBC34DRAFT_152015 [Podospora aff. communis PSN243]|uniref:Uncharacterized protein n=1 Tax=Podospora aff. communis PSN243 TaxID=3040156 RepID=A0AAV9GFW1_9PEZI|nr:hypothetical protein QBC34DRAFT_152015 [Podospora aff. communis PSN243]
MKFTSISSIATLLACLVAGEEANATDSRPHVAQAPKRSFVQVGFPKLDRGFTGWEPNADWRDNVIYLPDKNQFNASLDDFTANGWSNYTFWRCQGISETYSAFFSFSALDRSKQKRGQRWWGFCVEYKYLAQKDFTQSTKVASTIAFSLKQGLVDTEDNQVIHDL